MRDLYSEFQQLAMVRGRKPPSQTWRTFLENHLNELVSTDFLVLSTVSVRLFVVLGTPRRHAIHFNVTAHPTAEWTARQIAEAFPWDSAPRYLLQDRDCIYEFFVRALALQPAKKEHHEKAIF